MTIQAIQTRYSGCHFRSRTEARWAVFMDRLGIPWEYEPQGYVLDDGTPYLPDFLVYPGADHEFWLEIKGEFPAHDEISKAAQLARGTGKDTYLYFGPVAQPGRGLSRIKTWDEYFDEASAAWQWHDRLGWVLNGSEAARWQVGVQPTAFFFDAVNQKRRSAFIWWTDCPECGRVMLKVNGQVGWCPTLSDIPDEVGLYPNFGHESERLQAAYRAARSARFEHGESG